jgi:patatin-like phospholipase/acyl hydrolase
MKIILALDGGGIRGVVPAAILDYLEKRIQEIRSDKRIRIGNLMDLVGGTSTGSIIGSMMLLPCEEAAKKGHKRPKYSMEEITKMYIEMGPDVFKSHFWHNVKTLWGLFGSKFPASNIEVKLLEMMDHYKMKDLIRPCLFTGYDIDKRRVNIYTNKDKDEKYANFYVKDIIRGSTAIPAYFPPAYFNDGMDFHTIIDGGVFANNPSMVSYVEASKTIFDLDEKVQQMKPHDLFIISLGTGKSKKKNFPYKKSKHFGAVKWLFPVIDIMLAGTSDVTDYEMEKLFRSYGASDNYIRINPPLNFSSGTPTNASPENITNLLKDVNAYIKENTIFLNNLADEICRLSYFT